MQIYIDDERKRLILKYIDYTALVYLNTGSFNPVSSLLNTDIFICETDDSFGKFIEKLYV